MAWVVLLVLLGLAGALVWTVRTLQVSPDERGWLPSVVRRCCAWWLDLASESSVPAEPSQNSRPIVEPPPAKVAASRRKPIPASSTPKPQALSDESLPLIDLSAVASQLKDQRYRAHPALQPDADVVLPVLDARAIRENVKRRVAPRLAETALEAPLPVISPSEVEQNLQPLASRPRPVAATPTQPLPLINADEVRASLRQIHVGQYPPAFRPG